MRLERRVDGASCSWFARILRDIIYGDKRQLVNLFLTRQREIQENLPAKGFVAC